MNKSLIFMAIALAGSMLVMAGCSKQESTPETTMKPARAGALQTAPEGQQAMAAPSRARSGKAGGNMPGQPQAAGIAQSPNAAYVAMLNPLNTSVGGHHTSGKARFMLHNGKLTIHIRVTGTPPGIAHWQHIHGFTSGKAAHCPTRAADTNGDDIIDLIETHAASGITMVPLNADPVAMKVATHTYPVASDVGTYTYEKTVSLSALQKAFAKKFDGAQLNLASRVIYVHGVPATAELPKSVHSLPGAPAHVTLPIACGEINPARQAPMGQTPPAPSS